MDLKLEDVKDEIRTGDLLAFSGWGPLHFGIRLWEWFCYWYSGRRGRPLPKYSHCGMAIRINGKHLFLLEQETTGCRVIPLHKQLGRFRGTVWWYRVDGNRVDRYAMEEYGLSVVFTPYAYRELFQVFLFNEKIASGPGYCSSLYRAALQAGGYEWGDWSPMPDEVVDLPVLALRGKLVL